MSFSVALKDSKMKWLPEKPAYHDYSNDVKLTKNPGLRLVWRRSDRGVRCAASTLG